MRLITRLSPAFVTGLRIKRSNPRAFQVVVDHDHLTVMNDGRSCRAIVEDSLPRFDLLRPERLAVQPVAIQTQIPEQGVQSLAVGRRRFRCVSALGMARYLRLAGMRFVFPEFLARVQVEATNHPMMNALCWSSHTLAQIQPFAGREILLVTDHGGHEDAVAPDNRTRPAPARYVGCPRNIVRITPRRWQSRVVGCYAVRVRPTKTRPVVLRGSGRGKTNHCQKSE